MPKTLRSQSTAPCAVTLTLTGNSVSQSFKRSATPRRASAGVALHASAVAHQREVAALRAHLALVALGFRLGPATRKGDGDWTGLVRWTLFGLINAEEREISSLSLAADSPDSKAKHDAAVALGAPAVAPLHLADDWLAVVVGEVGNYGEIFERNLGESSPLAIKRGMNALWTNGGILYAPPMQ